MREVVLRWTDISLNITTILTINIHNACLVFYSHVYLLGDNAAFLL